jgi:hypothetical protein
MSFGYARNSGISWFRDYGDALHKYENTTNIRGRTEEPMRPLGHRKSVDMYSIVKLENGDIQCVLYKTPVVTFHMDNTVTIWHDAWSSQSTANFIPEVMGHNVSARVFNRKICLSVHGRECFVPENGIKLRKEDDVWVVSNAPQEFIHHIKRKESNNVMSKYAEVFGYLERMKKLRFDGEKASFSKEEIEECFGDAKDNYARRLDISLDTHYKNAPKLYSDFKTWIDDDTENKHLSYYKVMLVLVNSVGWLDWNTEERRMKAYHWEEAKTKLKNMIWGYHRDQVFTPIGLKQGTVRRDTYGRFFEGGWEKYHKHKNRAELSALSLAQTLDKGI